MNVHEFRKAIVENKDLYTQDELFELYDQWEKEYNKYLIDLVKKAKGGQFISINLIVNYFWSWSIQDLAY